MARRWITVVVLASVAAVTLSAGSLFPVRAQPSLLEGLFVQSSDGPVWAISAGLRHEIIPARGRDAELAALPEGDPVYGVGQLLTGDLEEPAVDHFAEPLLALDGLFVQGRDDRLWAVVDGVRFEIVVVPATPAEIAAIPEGRRVTAVGQLVPDGSPIQEISGLAAVPTPAPASPSRPAPGTVLYEADWSRGLNGWTGPEERAGVWSVRDGQLYGSPHLGHYVNTFANPLPARNGDFRMSLLPPFQPGLIRDYAVEADIQFFADRLANEGDVTTFGIEVRALGPDIGGYKVGFCHTMGERRTGKTRECARKEKVAFIGKRALLPYALQFFASTDLWAASPRRWMRWRVEAKSNVIRWYLDQRQVLELTDNRYNYGGYVGLFNGGAEVFVRSFRIVAL